MSTNVFAWIETARPKTLVAVIAPIILSHALIYKTTQSIHITLMLWIMVFGILLQTLTNYANDYFDITSGADHDRVGPKRAMHSAQITSFQMETALVTLSALILCCGLIIATMTHWMVIAWSLLFLFLCFGYSAGNYALSKTGLSDPFALIFFGPAVTVGSEYLQTGFITNSSVILGVICGCFSLMMLTINNLRDEKQDHLANRKTLVLRFGRAFGIGELFASATTIIIFSGLLMLSYFSTLLFGALATSTLTLVIAFEGFFATNNEQIAMLLPKLSLTYIVYTIFMMLGLCV